jgi:hypothetical protein
MGYLAQWDEVPPGRHLCKTGGPLSHYFGPSSLERQVYGCCQLGAWPAWCRLWTGLLCNRKKGLESFAIEKAIQLPKCCCQGLECIIWIGQEGHRNPCV